MALAVQLLIAALSNMGAIVQLIQTAQAEGRDVSPAELQSLILTDAGARARVVIAIAAAKAAGK